MTSRESRMRGVCLHCGRAATLARRLDGGSWRGIYWCFVCKKPAHAGDSFIAAPPEAMMRLPIVEAPNAEPSTQGKLPW